MGVAKKVRKLPVNKMIGTQGHYGILTDELTFEKSKSSITFEDCGTVQVKGKTQPIQIYKAVSTIDRPRLKRGLSQVRIKMIG